MRRFFQRLHQNFVVLAPSDLVDFIDVKAGNADLIEVHDLHVIVRRRHVNRWNLNRHDQLFDGARSVVENFIVVLNILDS